MHIHLTEIRKLIINKKVLITLVILIFLLVFAIPILLNRPSKITPEDIPPLLATQPVKEGKFDSKAEVSQNSKAEIEKLKPYLVYRKTIKTVTGSNVTFAVFAKPVVEHTLFVEIMGVNFRSNHDDPQLAKNVQDFREVARNIFDFIKSHNANPQNIFISWGGFAYIQNNAEAWLKESEEFPKVIKVEDGWEFEKNSPEPSPQP